MREIRTRDDARAAVVDMLGGQSAMDDAIEEAIESVLDAHKGGWAEFVPANVMTGVERRIAMRDRLAALVTKANALKWGESEIVNAINDDAEFGVYVRTSDDESGPIRVCDYDTGEIFATIDSFPATVGWAFVDEDGDIIY